MRLELNRRFRLGFVMAGPTQFEAPFFKFISSDRALDVRVLYLDGGEDDVYDPEIGRKVSWGFDVYEGYDYDRMPSNGWFMWLAKKISRGNFDALIINGYYSLPLFVTALIARLKGIKVALRLDTVEFEPGERSGIGKILKRVIYLLYDHFFVVSSLTASLLERSGIASGRISYFTYAVDVDHFRHESFLDMQARAALRASRDVPAGVKVILAVSKLSPRETPWDLLHAFEKLQRRDTILYIVGDGPDRGEAEQFASRRLKGQVFFAGYVAYLELPKIYAIADLYVHAASDEPWGVSVAEAMACGLPVIASSRVGAGYDLISEGENGFRYEFGNTGDLAEKLELALTRLNPADAAKKNVEMLSSWDYRSSWANILRFCGHNR